MYVWYVCMYVCMTCTDGSALPESDCTLINSLIDDKGNRSVIFDGAVHVCMYVCCSIGSHMPPNGSAWPPVWRRQRPYAGRIHRARQHQSVSRLVTILYSSPSTSSALLAASCRTPLQRTVTVTSHLVRPRQAVHLVNCRRGCGMCMAYPGKRRLPYIRPYSDNHTAVWLWDLDTTDNQSVGWIRGWERSRPPPQNPCQIYAHVTVTMLFNRSGNLHWVIPQGLPYARHTMVVVLHSSAIQRAYVRPPSKWTSTSGGSVPTWSMPVCCLHCPQAVIGLSQSPAGCRQYYERTLTSTTESHLPILSTNDEFIQWSYPPSYHLLLWPLRQ